jgi:hypothetical protein
MLDIEVMFLGRAMLILNLALRAGSSKHGNALRASVGWNCVVAIHLERMWNIIELQYINGIILILLVYQDRK